MRSLSTIFALALLFSSCKMFSFENPELRGKEKISISSVKGRTIEFVADVKVFNPNWYALKVKPSTLDLYVEGEYMGKVHLDKKVKLKGKIESDLSATFTATLTAGALIKAIKYATQDEIKIQLKGKIKGGVFFVSKNFDINETKTIPGASFKMGK